MRKSRRKKLASKQTEPPEKVYECGDCYAEALMYIGIYDSSTAEPPAELREKFDKMYDAEFYESHVNPKGWRASIRPRMVTA